MGAANDSFPRGGSKNVQVGSGTAASFTIPACPGIIHVLDAFFAKVLAGVGGAAFEGTITLTSSLGTYSAYPLGTIFATGVSTSDSSDDPNVNLTSLPGEAMTIAFNGTTPSGDNQLLGVKWHDI